MACFALVTSATEADVLRQAWIRKVQELKLGLPDDGGTVAFFRSPLTILNLRQKVSEWKRRCAIDRAQVQELAEDVLERSMNFVADGQWCTRERRMIRVLTFMEQRLYLALARQHGELSHEYASHERSDEQDSAISRT